MPAFVSSLRHRLERLASALRVRAARASGARVGAACRVRTGCDLALTTAVERTGAIELGDRCRLEAGVLLHPYGGRVRLGNDVFIGPYTVIYGHGGVEIGDDTLLSMHCRVLSSNHSIPSPDRRIRWEPDVLRPTRIGRDVWLGAGVTVLGGVTIGDGCVVGAGAVVSHDLPPGSIALGVPARVTGSRSASGPASA